MKDKKMLIGGEIIEIPIPSKPVDFQHCTSCVGTGMTLAKHDGSEARTLCCVCNGQGIIEVKDK